MKKKQIAKKIAEQVNKKEYIVKKLSTENNELYGSVKPTEISKIISDIDKIEIRPGVIERNKKGFTCTPIITTIVSLETNNCKVEKLYPGGLSGIGTLIDPYYGQKDRMAGQIAGLPGKLPPIYSELQLKINPVEELSSDYQLKNGDKVKITLSPFFN